MTRRLAMLVGMLALSFGMVYSLPRSYTAHVSAMPGSLWTSDPGQPDAKWELPRMIFAWQGGRSLRPSPAEQVTLSADTKFAKRNFQRTAFGVDSSSLSKDAVYEELSAFVVTSGTDMNNSIHRPERCLPAQGLNIDSAKDFSLPLGRGRQLPVRKLSCSGAVTLSTGGVATFHNVTYYWFVGHTALTNGHWERTWLDIKDRLFQGYDQEWAYATVAMSTDSHPVLLASKYDRLRDETERRKDSKKLTSEEATSAQAWMDELDRINPTPEKEAEALTKLLADSKSPALTQLFADNPVRHEDTIRKWSRPIDNTKEDEKGLTEADRIMQQFIIDFAREVIDPKMISTWNQPAPAAAPAQAATR